MHLGEGTSRWEDHTLDVYVICKSHLFCLSATSALSASVVVMETRIGTCVKGHNRQWVLVGNTYLLFQRDTGAGAPGQERVVHQCAL